MVDGVTSHVNPAHVFGTDEWVAKNLQVTRNTLRSAEGDVKLVVSKVPFLRDYAKRHGKVWEDFCRTELRAEPAWIGKLEEGVAILTSKGHTGPITKADAVAAVAASTKPLGPRGKPAGSSSESKHNNGNVKVRQGNDPEYLAARIARDAPQVLEDMKAGKFKSVRAAAKAAGIVKDPDVVTVAARAVLAVPTHRLAEFVCRLPVDIRKLLAACIKDAGVRP